ncbi:katanin P80 subunit [Anopheles darlingi]|uniref:Katanin p80 WD40 repeat-containing subunit B1 n=1 Tax=Anopheles darlingi TaxID=43151 RepID=W5JU10_ANODA|nr:katanin p80 WD40 repeat-containing subunit B1 [Anopheles darlingi]ETN67621.1 katanin P80 subunit [Anopheles darlingi]
MASVTPRRLPSNIYHIQAHSRNVTCLNLGETGRVLVTGGHDFHVKLWAFSSQECSMTLAGHNSSIEYVKFAYSDDFVYSADDTGIIKLWNLNANSASTSLYGHMKSVRTLDVNPMDDNFVVSGSNDTSIRLWDIREKSCVTRYRGHMSYVNSVKISPDGLWIASAGDEGSVMIWDIRTNKLCTEFTERKTPATYVQYHPSDLLMAAGRQDGTVDLYDLEQSKLLTRTTRPPPATAASNGQPVRCVTFDESGKCLFVGTAAGINVIGWEPDQEFDQIALNVGSSAALWQLGDMHIAGQELIYSTYEGGEVAVYVVPLSGLRAFWAKPNVDAAFAINQTSRKSFSRGSGKQRLSIGVDRLGTTPGLGAGGGTAVSASLADYDECSGSNVAGGGGGMSPNLSIEMIDEEDMNAWTVATSGTHRERPAMRRPSHSAQTPYYAPKVAGSGGNMQSGAASATSSGNVSTGTNRATTSSRGRQNVTASTSATSSNGARSSVAEQRRLAMSSRSTSNLMHRNSKSTFELNKLGSGEEPVTFRKPISRGSSPIRSNHHPQLQHGGSKMHRSDSAQVSNGRQYGIDRHQRSNGGAPSHNGNIKVEIVTKPVVRSKTSLDIRHGHGRSTVTNSSSSNSFHSGPRQPSAVMHSSSIPTNGDGQLLRGLSQSHRLHENGNGFGDGIGISNGSMSATEELELQMLSQHHHVMMQTLQNRNALLLAIRRYTSEGNIIGALKVAVQMSDHQLLVDLLGAMLEKTSQWTLDMCVLLLPKLYSMLQSEVKFHCTRACDTLRDMLGSFLPVIRENTDPLGACTIGVDVSREERQKKCLECKRWLLQIRSLPENCVGVSIFQQLQTMITDI